MSHQAGVPVELHLYEKGRHGVGINPKGVAVGTGQGVVLLRRVQSAGGAEEPADAWALRRGLRPGALVTGAA